MKYRWLIENRKSVREFKETDVHNEILQELMDYGLQIKSPFKVSTKFILIEDGWEKKDVLRGRTGYGGHPVYAPHYIGILSEEKDEFLQNAGYIMEELLLKAVSLELGTCWISVVNQEETKEALGIDSSDHLVALAAIGYPKGHIPYTPKSTSLRMSLNEFIFHKRWDQKPWIEELEMRGLAKILYHIRMAPSWQNLQPWKLIVDDNEIILVVGQENSNTNSKNLLIDAGIMMLYMERIFNEEGLVAKWSLYEEALKKDYEIYSIPKEYHIIGSLHI